MGVIGFAAAQILSGTGAFLVLFVFVEDFWIALFGGPVVGCILAFGILAKAAARRPPEHPLNDSHGEDRSELIARLVSEQCHELQRGGDEAPRSSELARLADQPVEELPGRPDQDSHPGERKESGAS